jgi:hypothetical protein
MPETLYDTDFYEWTQQQSRRLREAAAERISLPIDWENVAEEIESLGKRDVRSATSHVVRIVAHFLKLADGTRGSPFAAMGSRTTIFLRPAPTPSNSRWTMTGSRRTGTASAEGCASA